MAFQSIVSLRAVKAGQDTAWFVQPTFMVCKILADPDGAADIPVVIVVVMIVIVAKVVVSKVAYILNEF